MILLNEVLADKESMPLFGKMKYFPKCSIKHIGRMANETAHKLVRYEWHLEDLVMWLYSFFKCITQTSRTESLMYGVCLLNKSLI